MTWLAALRGWWKVLAGAVAALLAMLAFRGRGGARTPTPPGRPDAGQKEYDDARDQADRDLVRRLGDADRRYREAADALRRATGADEEPPPGGPGAA